MDMLLDIRFAAMRPLIIVVVASMLALANAQVTTPTTTSSTLTSSSANSTGSTGSTGSTNSIASSISIASTTLSSTLSASLTTAVATTTLKQEVILDFLVCFVGCPCMINGPTTVFVLPCTTNCPANLTTVSIPTAGVPATVTAAAATTTATVAMVSAVAPAVIEALAAAPVSCPICPSSTATVSAPTTCSTVVVCNPVITACPQTVQVSLGLLDKGADGQAANSVVPAAQGQAMAAIFLGAAAALLAF